MAAAAVNINAMIYYFIWAEQLVYVEGGNNKSVYAVSGQRRGAYLVNEDGSLDKKTIPIYVSTDSNSLSITTADGKANPKYDWNVKENPAAGVSGGPIPPGYYDIGQSQTETGFGRFAPLSPLQPCNRSGLLIHGRGPHGSEGCIVIMRKDELKSILDYCDANDPTLCVIWDADLIKSGLEQKILGGIANY